MQAIETVTVGSGGAASITFSAIPADYTDLKLVISARCDNSNRQDIFAQFNGVSTATYSMRRLYGEGSGSGQSDSVSNNDNGFRCGRSTSVNDTASTFASTNIYIPNYSVSGVAKTASAETAEENNATSALQFIWADYWSGTDAIASILLQNLAGNFVEHSTATLYGILAGSDGTTTVT